MFTFALRAAWRAQMQETGSEKSTLKYLFFALNRDKSILTLKKLGLPGFERQIQFVTQPNESTN